MTPEKACEQAIKAIGGPAKVVELFADTEDSLTTQAVSQWRVIPPKRVLTVLRAAAAKGKQISMHDARPDIYGPDPAKNQAAA